MEISETDKILKGLEIKTLNSEQDYKKMDEMNEAMKQVKRDYKNKSGHSKISAGECYVNTNDQEENYSKQTS